MGSIKFINFASLKRMINNDNLSIRLDANATNINWI